MYPDRYVRYINLPKIPDSIVQNLNRNFEEYDTSVGRYPYSWSDSFNSEINLWCQKNICDTMYFAFQIIRGDLFLHKDVGTRTKFIYLFDTGGDNVVTEFYDDDQTTLLDSIVIEPLRWHILKADTYHCVKNVKPDKIRFSLTGKIF